MFSTVKYLNRKLSFVEIYGKRSCVFLVKVLHESLITVEHALMSFSERGNCYLLILCDQTLLGSTKIVFLDSLTMLP